MSKTVIEHYHSTLYKHPFYKGRRWALSGRSPYNKQTTEVYDLSMDIHTNYCIHTIYLPLISHNV